MVADACLLFGAEKGRFNELTRPFYSSALILGKGIKLDLSYSYWLLMPALSKIVTCEALHEVRRAMRKRGLWINDVNKSWQDWWNACHR